MPASLFIDGAAGTTGLEIAERLAGRSDIALVTLAAEERKDIRRRRAALNDCNIAILCLPDDAAREAVGMVDNPRTVIIDASTAHRTAPGWIYGFHELDPDQGRNRLATAKRIANPGCYPTGFLALVVPLIRAGLLDPATPLTIHAVSGYSGGGREMIAAYADPEQRQAWSGYARSLSHKHLPEMQRHAGLVIAPLFTPAVVDCYRGMVVEVPLRATQLAGDRHAIHACWAGFYADAPLVRVAARDDAAGNLAITRLAGRDSIELLVTASPDGAQLLLSAVLDNLGKGAAGAAVQTVNLLLGIDETTGLRL